MRAVGPVIVMTARIAAAVIPAREVLRIFIFIGKSREGEFTRVDERVNSGKAFPRGR